MSTAVEYQHRRNQGLCPTCGRFLDQRPYTKCSRCYTPHPKPQLFPHQPGSGSGYRQAWRWHQRQQVCAPVEVGCCGQFHAVTQTPFQTPCCGKTFFAVAQEPL
jgi:hypothetical protein